MLRIPKITGSSPVPAIGVKEKMVSAEEIAKSQAETITGYVNLFYNNKTAERYYLMLIALLVAECKGRGIEIKSPNQLAVRENE